MAGNPMISVCVRLRHIYSHIQTCTRNEALKLFEDMFSVDFSQNRTGTRFRGHHKLLCCHIQEIFFSDWYYLFKFFCRFLNIQWYQSVPVHSSSVTGASKRPEQLQCSCFSNPDLVSKDDPAARLAYRWRKVI
jgi:hypothetical protein